MAEIPSILNTSITNPQLQYSGENQQGAEQNFQQVARQSEQILNQQASIYDETKRQADRASLIAQESATQAALNMNETDLKLSESSVRLMGTLASINEQEKRQYDQARNESWLANQKFQIESGYISDTQSALSSISPDGSGYANGRMEYFNKALLNARQTAPSEDAFLDLYKQIQVGKVDAYKKAADVEQKQLQSHNLSMIGNGVNSIVNTVRTNPALLQDARKQLSYLDTPLKTTGLSTEEIAQYKQKQDQELVKQAINGFLDNKQMNAAIDLLSDPSLLTTDAGDYNKIVDSVHSANNTSIRGQGTEAEKAKIKSLILNKAIDRQYPGVTEQGDIMFNDFATSTLAEINTKGIDGVVNDMYGFLNEYGFAMGNKTSGRIAGIISNSQDPVQVGAYSLLIDKLARNPDGAGSAVFKELGDKDTLAEATLIGNYINNGVAPDQAMKLAREDIRLKYNPAKEAQITKFLNEAEKNDSSFWTDIAFSLYDGIGPDSEASADNVMYDLKQAYRSFYIETQNQDVAEARTRQYLINAGYGITYANGTKELNKAVPEAYYKDKNLLQEFYFNAFKAINEKGYSFVSTPLIGGEGEQGGKFFYKTYKDVKDDTQTYLSRSKAITQGIYGSNWNPINSVVNFSKGLLNLPLNFVENPKAALTGNLSDNHNGFWVKDNKTGAVSKLILKPIMGRTENEPISKKTYDLVDSTTGVSKFHYTFDMSNSAITKNQEKVRQMLSDKRDKENTDMIMALNKNDQILKMKK